MTEINIASGSASTARAENIPIDQIDVSKHELYESTEVLPLFARLRREAPVHYCANSAFGPYWSITKHEDIMRVDTDPVNFSSDIKNGGVSISDDAYRQIRGKVDFIVEDIGWRSLKNIANPMRVWRIQISGAARSVAPRTSRMTRRLAAILVADVAGFTSLVKADETDALERLGALRYEIIEPNITRHAGRLVRVTGDGFLAEFPSAVQAVACAIAIQAETEQVAAPLNDNVKMRLRVGVHAGEVMVEGEDLAGESVYIASRLESITVPGGISISRAVHDQVRDRINVCFDDKGEIPLKNIMRPIQVFGVSGAKQSKTTDAD